MQSKTDKTRPAANQHNLRCNLVLMASFGTRYGIGPRLRMGAAARREAERLRREVANANRVLHETRKLERLARKSAAGRAKD